MSKAGTGYQRMDLLYCAFWVSLGGITNLFFSRHDFFLVIKYRAIDGTDQHYFDVYRWHVLEVGTGPLDNERPVLLFT